MLHLLIEADWRTAGRWGSLATCLLPLSGDQWLPARWSTRYVLGLACRACGERYLASAPIALPQPCPGCGHPLARVAAWDMQRQGHPPWHDVKEP